MRLFLIIQLLTWNTFSNFLQTSSFLHPIKKHLLLVFIVNVFPLSFIINFLKFFLALNSYFSLRKFSSLWLIQALLAVFSYALLMMHEKRKRLFETRAWNESRSIDHQITDFFSLHLDRIAMNRSHHTVRKRKQKFHDQKRLLFR